MTTVSFFNPYPQETKWRRHIPKDSPLSYLRYGIFSEKIEPLLKKELRERRKKTIMFYIMNTHNRLLDIAFNDILRDAKQLVTYKHSDWIVGNRTKRERIYMMIKNDVSLAYIREAYLRYKAGPFNFKPGNLIKIPRLTSYLLHHKQDEYGIVTNVTKTHIKYVRVDTKNVLNNDTITYEPIWWKLYTGFNYKNNSFYHPSIKKSIWDARYVGHLNKKIGKRNKKWKNTIYKRYLLQKKSELLTGMSIPMEYFIDDSFDIFKEELSKNIIEQKKKSYYLRVTWDAILREAKRYKLELENIEYS